VLDSLIPFDYIKMRHTQHENVRLPDSSVASSVQRIPSFAQKGRGGSETTGTEGLGIQQPITGHQQDLSIEKFKDLITWGVFIKNKYHNMRLTAYNTLLYVT